jgi:hypothetical protein
MLGRASLQARRTAPLRALRSPTSIAAITRSGTTWWSMWQMPGTTRKSLPGASRYSGADCCLTSVVDARHDHHWRRQLSIALPQGRYGREHLRALCRARRKLRRAQRQGGREGAKSAGPISSPSPGSFNSEDCFGLGKGVDRLLMLPLIMEPLTFGPQLLDLIELLLV